MGPCVHGRNKSARGAVSIKTDKQLEYFFQNPRWIIPNNVKDGRQMDERYHDQDSRSTVILVLSWSSHGGNNNVVGLAFSVEVVVAAVTGYL